MHSNSYSCKILINIGLSRPIFKKYSKAPFHENPFILRRVVPYGRTDMTELLVAFFNFTKVPENLIFVS